MKKIALLISVCLLLAACSPAEIQSQIQSTFPTATLPATSVVVSSATANATSSVTTTQAPIPTVQPTVETPVATANSTAAAGTNSYAGAVPNFDHIIEIVLENESYNAIIGSPNLPNLNALANKYVLLNNDFAVTHPSLPNYLSLVSGSPQGVSSDCTTCFVNAPNLADLIEKSGRTWKSYEESLPSPCYIGDSNPYAQKHDPFLYFDNIRLDKTRCDRSIVPLTQLDTDLAANQLPNFAFITPNLCNDGHDCSDTVADGWVNQMVTKLQSSPALGNNYLIIITFDEGSTSTTASCCGMAKRAGGQVVTILISPEAKSGFTDSTPVSHYGILKTILVAWNLPDLGNTSMPQTQPIVLPWQK